MKKLIKKNQVIITALAIMIAIAGYINYKDIVGKEKIKQADANVVINNKEDSNVDKLGESDEIINNDAEPDDYSILEPGAAIFTGSNNLTFNSDFIIKAKLDREQIRAVNKQTLLDIINNDSVSEEEKNMAVAQMLLMTDIAEKEAAAELLLEAKGFNDVIVSITSGQADIVINRDSLTDTERAQIEDVIKRKTDIPVENITISAVVPKDGADMTVSTNTSQ